MVVDGRLEIAFLSANLRMLFFIIDLTVMLVRVQVKRRRVDTHTFRYWSIYLSRIATMNKIKNKSQCQKKHQLFPLHLIGICI